MSKKKIVLVSLASFAAGVASMSALVVSIGQSNVNGTSQDHPFVKGLAWVTTKYITKDFDPNAELL